MSDAAVKELQAKIQELEAFKSNCKCQGPKKAKQQKQKKKKKKVKIDKSDVVFKVEKGENGDFKEIEAEIRKIDIDGLMWASQFAEVDFVFGMKVLQVGCQIEDLMVPETAPVIAEIKEIKNVLNCELVNIGTAEADWGGKSSGKAKKKKSKGPKMEITSVEIAKAIDQYAQLARESEMYVSGVNAMDRSGAMDVTEAQLTEAAKGISAKKPDLSFVVIAAGKTKIGVVGVIPASWATRTGADAKALVTAGFDEDSKFTVTGDKSMAYGVQNMDKDKNQFALKEKEQVTSRVFNYYNKSGLCPDSDDESEGSMDDLSED